MKSFPLKPVLTKVPIVRLSELNPGDHIFIDSEHCLVKSIDTKLNTIEVYALDSRRHVTCIKKNDIFGKSKQYRIDYDSKTHLYHSKETLKIAEEEIEKVTEWQRCDMFVTMAKCGFGFIVHDRCIMPDVVEMHLTDIVGNTSVDNGDHLLIREVTEDHQIELRSVLVYKFYHQTKIEVMLSNSHERRVIDLTQYKERYRVNYNHSLPSQEVNIRAESKAGKKLLKDNCSVFIPWAKTGKEIKLPPDLLERAKRLSIIRPISYEKVLSPDEIHVGDHLFWDKDKVKSYRQHVMVTECNVEENPIMFRSIYCSKTRFKEKVKCFARSMGEDTYKVNYPEALPPQLAIKRARSQLGEHNFKPLARLWFVRWAKTGSDEGLEIGFLKNNTRPVTKSRITCFSQLNRGDYLVEEPKLNFYHHYIVLKIESPTQCIVVESWRHNIQRKVLTCEKIHDPNQRPWFYRINYEKCICISPKVSVKNAQDLINTSHANPFSKCFRENFVHHLKTGEAASIDTDELLDDRILLQRERVTSAMELKCGDHIERPLSMAPNHAYHHMLVVEPVDDEHCEVIHYKVHKSAAKVLKFKKGDVTREIVNVFELGQVSRIRYPERINPLHGMKRLTDLSKDGSKTAIKAFTGMVCHIIIMHEDCV